MRRRSLSRKLVILVATAVTAGMAVSALLSAWQEVERYADARRQLLRATAQAFAAAAATSIAELKQQETLEAIRGVGRVPGFLFVQVRTPDGRVLAAFGGASRLVTDPLLSSDETPSISNLLRSGTVLVTVPVINGGNEVGRINLISDTADLWPRLLASLWLTLLASLAALTVGLLIAWRFQRSITHPLRRLLGAMDEVRRDHSYDVRVEEAIRSGDRSLGRWLQCDAWRYPRSRPKADCLPGELLSRKSSTVRASWLARGTPPRWQIKPNRTLSPL